MLADGRALRPEFLDLLRGHGVLKPRKHFALWQGTRRAGGISHRTLKALCEGQPVDPQWVHLLIAFCLDEKELHHAHNRQALAEFCTRLGQPLSAFTRDQMVRAVSVPAERASVNEAETLPAHLAALARYLAPLGPAGLQQLVQPAINEPDAAAVWIPTLSRWIFIEHGRQHSPRRRLNEEQAIALATTKVGTDLLTYTGRARAWAEREPWTVTLARVDGVVLGGSIALPLTQDCFERVASGQINTWQIEPSDLCSPSLHVVAESITMKPAAGYAVSRTVTVPVHSALMTQVACLTAVEGAGDLEPIRILSADFSSRNKRNLDRAEFETTQVTLPGTDQRLRRRTIDLTSMAKADYEFFGFWRMLQASLRGVRGGDHRRQSHQAG